MTCRLIQICTLVLACISEATAAYALMDAWDREGAVKAWEHAQELKRDIIGKSSPSLAEYLNCIRYFQKVYKLDPHYSRSDDAIFEAAAIYHKIGESFGDTEHLRMAAQLSKFLSEDYPTSMWVPEALLLLGDLNAGPLDSPAAAQAAYARLTSRYGKSQTAARYLARSKSPIHTLPDQSRRSSIPSVRELRPLQGASEQVPSPPLQPNILKKLEHNTESGYTNVTIETSGQVSYRIQRLQQPDRVFFDLENVILPKNLRNSTVLIQDSRLKQVRIGQNRPLTARVVLDLEGKTDYSLSELRDPFRIVINVFPLAESVTAAARSRPAQGNTAHTRVPSAGETMGAMQVRSDNAKFAASASQGLLGPSTGTASYPVATQASSVAQETSPRTLNPRSSMIRSALADSEVSTSFSNPPARIPEPPLQPKMSIPTSLGNRTVTRSLGLKVGRIVIDPGHGGHDMGTIGPGGLVEKDLVLNLALDLRTLLEERLGAEVILTREDDNFVTLEDRTAIANASQADLFVSLHANYSTSKSTSGVETYFLDFARTREEREVAARENAATMRTVGDLQSLIGRIVRGEKLEESRELASVIQKSLFSTARQLLRSPKDRGVRSAPFIVLVGAEMPSILVEVAFLSNPTDERAMKLESNRQRIASALLSGIAAYMKTLGSEIANFSASPIR